MPRVGRRCHELRVPDGNNWRIAYRIDEDAILFLEVFAKKTSPHLNTSSTFAGFALKHTIQSRNFFDGLNNQWTKQRKNARAMPDGAPDP